MKMIGINALYEKGAGDQHYYFKDYITSKSKLGSVKLSLGLI